MLPFKEFEFHGFLGKRRVVSFGWRYNFDGTGLQETTNIPEFLFPVRERAATFAELAPSALEHVLASEYPAGAGIGWQYVPSRPQTRTKMGAPLFQAAARQSWRAPQGALEARCKDQARELRP